MVTVENASCNQETEGQKPKKLTSKEKKMKRKEEIAKHRAVEEAVRAANKKTDLLKEFAAFSKYERNGLNVRLEFLLGDQLTPALKQFIAHLLKSNMELPYGDEWPAAEKNKRREMIESDARYIIVRRASSGARSDEPTQASQGQQGGDLLGRRCEPKQQLAEADDDRSCPVDQKTEARAEGDGDDDVVGFVHFRFVVEEEVQVLYAYEVQLIPEIQRKGLGKFLMQLLELIARKNSMKGVMLTVQKRNVSAMSFYVNKLRYCLDSISPSKVDPLAESDTYTYEILSKIFDAEAKAHLKERAESARQAWAAEY